MMLALYLKDLRLNRAPVIGAIVLPLVFYVIPLATVVLDRPRQSVPDIWRLAIASGAGTGLSLMVLMCAVFGGVAFAPERRDRSAEFLAMLPVRRWEIALSKLFAAGTCVLVLCAVHGLVLAVCSWGVTGGQWSGDVLRIYATFPFTGLLLFGLAWLFSTFMRSPTFAAVLSMVCSALVSWVLMGIVALAVDARHGGHTYENLFLVTSVVGAVVGLVCLIAGTAYYCARVSP
jgi:ABC-type transport system involved in multi-copper enzyme maturation permease subunit